MTRPSRPEMPAIEASDTVAVNDIIDNRYRIKKLLGEGATSRVYLADDTALDKTVALKILRSSAANRGRTFLRFEQEARVMIAISHPNVCRVLGFGRLPDARPYLVMEFLHGKTLYSLMRKKKRLDERVALAIIQQLLAALIASHKLGIVHRDVKPSNVFLAKRETGVGLVKLLDFGLAKAPADRAVVVTRPGLAFGTPGYAAPEVLLSGGAASFAADVWSVAVMLFEMLAGVRPYPDPSNELSAFEVALSPPRRLRDHAPGVSDEIVSVIDEAMQKLAERRISAETFARRLADITDDIGPPSTVTMTITDSLPVPPMELPVLERTPLNSMIAPPLSSDAPLPVIDRTAATSMPVPPTGSDPPTSDRTLVQAMPPEFTEISTLTPTRR